MNKIFKNFLLIILQVTLLSLNSVVSAAEIIPCPPKVWLHDGVYIGLGAGYDSYQIREQTNLTIVPGNTLNTDMFNTANGLVSNLLLGYGRYFDWFYFAGEILGHYSTAENTAEMAVSGLTYQPNVHIRMGYGLSLLPGIKLTEASLFFLQLGYVRTFIKTQETGMMGTNFSTSQTEWYNGFLGGLGIEVAIKAAWSLRGDYSYTWYDSNVSDINTVFKPRQGQFALSLLYRFE